MKSLQQVRNGDNGTKTQHTFMSVGPEYLGTAGSLHPITPPKNATKFETSLPNCPELVVKLIDPGGVLPLKKTLIIGFANSSVITVPTIVFNKLTWLTFKVAAYFSQIVCCPETELIVVEPQIS